MYKHLLSMSVFVYYLFGRSRAWVGVLNGLKAIRASNLPV